MFSVFPLHNTPTPRIYTLSLHDALPICGLAATGRADQAYALSRLNTQAEVREHSSAIRIGERDVLETDVGRSEEHISELQSHSDLVCRLLLEKKKITRHLSWPLS